MTMKNGFIVGIVVGFIAFLFLHGNTEITRDPLVMFIAIFAIVLFPIISFCIGIASALQGHSVFGTTTDGFIYGFTAALDAPYIVNLIIQFLNGNLPLPW